MLPFAGPATFSQDFSYAYHVVPLHALKSIASNRRLHSKADLQANQVAMQRASTAEVDNALGFSQFIHFYLPKRQDIDFSELPILNTQLKESGTPPFPHAVFAVSTKDLTDSQCAICNFNAAISRPAYGTVKGGNHSRGMAPQAILKHWLGFKDDSPNPKRLRYSYWHEGIAVPLLVGDQITNNSSKIGFRTSNAELLLKSPFEIPQSSRLYVFSDADLDSLSLLNHELPVQLHQGDQFAWYSSEDRVEPQVRAIINSYFRDKDGPLPSLNYDRRRAST